MEKYEFGRCKQCLENGRPLKDGYCINCKPAKPPVPDFLNDLFKRFDSK